MSQNSNASAGSEEDEISVLDYARANGIASTKFTETLHLFCEDLQDDLLDDGSLTSDAQLPQLKLQEVSVTERLTLSREGAKLLGSINKIEPIDDLVLPFLNCRQSRKLRIEPPLLRSDHESDCKDFTRREGFDIKLKDIKLPQEFIDEDKGEGMSFDPHLFNKGDQLIEQLKHEKLLLSRDTVHLLQNVYADKRTDEDDEDLMSNLLPYKKNTAREPVTPPLLPMSPPFTPYEPTSSELELPLLSDPASLTGQELEALEKKLFEQDVPTPIRNMVSQAGPESPGDGSGSSSTMQGDVQEINIGYIYSPLKAWEDNNSIPEIEPRRLRKQDLMVEEILTPPEPATMKTVHFSDILDKMLLNIPRGSLSPKNDVLQDDFFQEAFGEAADKAKQMLEQERLEEADTTARVEVPLMDFTTPDPPWKNIERHGNSALLEVMQREMIKQSLDGILLDWPGGKKVLGQLQWNPFAPDLAKVALEEPYIPDDGTWKVYIQELEDGDVINAFSLASGWKEPGLRILREDDEDEDDIEAGQFHKETLDLSSLVKKRQLEMTDEDTQDLSSLAKRRRLDIPDEEEKSISMVNPQRQRDSISTLVKQFLARKSAQDRASPAVEGSKDSTTAEQRLAGGRSLLGGHFSASDNLDNFLELRGSKKQKLVDSSHFPTATRPTGEISVAPRSLPALPLRQSPVARPAEALSVSLPAPPVDPHKGKTTIIISAVLLSQQYRPLIREVQNLFPSLEFLERDYNRHNSTAWMPGSVSRSPITSPLSYEADLNTSPTTGIILTTLQKIKQKPLPGQKAKPEIRQRVEKVCLRYEKLIVLISDGITVTTAHGIDILASDTVIALSDFIGFTSGLPCQIAAHYIPGPSNYLAKWLTSIIIKNSTPDPPESYLLDEETHWELFMRRAGLNSFAAQAILCALKPPDGVDDKSLSKMGMFGLTAFVEMGRQQRVHQFQGVCGGRRVLERVSAVIDGMWD